MNTTVAGIYNHAEAANTALARLVAAGFKKESVSLVLADSPEHARLVKEATKETHSGILSGLVAGGLFASLLVGTLSLPGIGLLAVGPVVAALGAGGVGAAAGGAIGALVGHGMSTYYADLYEEALHEEGAILVIVHTDRHHSRPAVTVLNETGAKHVAETVHPGHASEAAGGATT